MPCKTVFSPCTLFTLVWQQMQDTLRATSFATEPCAEAGMQLQEWRTECMPALYTLCDNRLVRRRAPHQMLSQYMACMDEIRSHSLYPLLL